MEKKYASCVKVDVTLGPKSNVLVDGVCTGLVTNSENEKEVNVAIVGMCPFCNTHFKWKQVHP